MQNSADIIRHRLHNQRLSQTGFSDPAEVVGWLGAVQSQDYNGAKWALGLRLQNATDADVEQAFTDGKMLRTHVMRPTWHFVTPADIHWMLALTAPRVKALTQYYWKQFELDEAEFSEANTIVTKALEGSKHLTRAELGVILGQAGISADDPMRVGHMLFRAELDGLVCSGARRGKQQTYALLDERAPQTRTWERDEALAEFARRYFTSHGPATVQDFTWWSGLTAGEAKEALELAKTQLESESVDGQTYWFSATSPINPAAPADYLLPPYDEYTVAYKERGAFLDPIHNEAAGNGIFDPVIVLGGRIVGTWKRTFKKATVIIEALPFVPFMPEQSAAFEVAAQRYGAFHEVTVVLA